jgi:hypothetical protein
MPQQSGTVDPVVRLLVTPLVLVTWLGIYALLTRVVSRPVGRFRLTACAMAGMGCSLTIGWLVQLLVFGPAGAAATERVAAEQAALTLALKVGAVVACAGLALGAWARVADRPLLVALVRPPSTVGTRALLGPWAFLALYSFGWGVGALACGLPLALGYV